MSVSLSVVKYPSVHQEVVPLVYRETVEELVDKRWLEEIDGQNGYYNVPSSEGPDFLTGPLSPATFELAEALLKHHAEETLFINW